MNKSQLQKSITAIRCDIKYWQGVVKETLSGDESTFERYDNAKRQITRLKIELQQLKIKLNHVS